MNSRFLLVLVLLPVHQIYTMEQENFSAFGMRSVHYDSDEENSLLRCSPKDLDDDINFNSIDLSENNNQQRSGSSLSTHSFFSSSMSPDDFDSIALSAVPLHQSLSHHKRNHEENNSSIKRLATISKLLMRSQGKKRAHDVDDDASERYSKYFKTDDNSDTDPDL